MSALIGIETLIITAIILLLSASWRLHQKRKYFRNVTSKLPTLYGIPFIGHAYHFLDVNSKCWDKLLLLQRGCGTKVWFNCYTITELYHKVSLTFDNMKKLTGCVWIATTPFVVTIDPEVIKHVTSSPEFINKATDLYTHFRNSVLNGIIVSPGNISVPPRVHILFKFFYFPHEQERNGNLIARL